MDSNKRLRNSRIQKMLDYCQEHTHSEFVINSPLTQESEKENQYPGHLLPPEYELQNKNQPEIVQAMSLSEQHPIQLCNIEKHRNCPKQPGEVTLVNYLNTKDYSFTSSIFDKLAETKNNSEQSLPSIDNLLCHEIMLPMSIPNSPFQDFSSDDSVKDKDYCPSDESDLSEDNCDSRIKSYSKLHRTTQKTGSVASKQPAIVASTSTSDSAIVASTSTSHSEQPTVGVSTATSHSEQPAVVASASTSEIAGLEKQINKEIILNAKERKLHQKQQKRLKYSVKPGCDIKCSKKCSTKLSENTRSEINKYYWDLSWQERRVFMQTSTSVAIPKRKITGERKRAPRSTFNLKTSDGTQVEVCKIFFLTTLGFHKNNDTVLYNSLNNIEKNDRRGLHTKTPRIDRDIITRHVDSFHPLQLHYRREHAPLRRYLPCDVTIQLMHKDFCEKNPSQKVSYELYRKHVNSMHISFTKLGNEECETCEGYFLHSKSTSHDAKNTVPENCDACVLYDKHRQKYIKARDLYDQQKKKAQSLENIFFSVDLQKVIMLPRLDCFKAMLFCPRLTSFNLTFAPLGKITHQNKPLACIWHDAVSGRKQEDIISCYYYFLLQYRDVKHINIWMDNCSAQNKNWLLFSFMIFMINNDLIATESINFFYFEPGHTFMSCDQFYHQVELAMKKKGKLYDFQDFHDCVSSANLSKVDVKAMECNDFFNFPDCVSERRIQTTNPRVYLKNIIEVKFERNNWDLLYKNELDEEFKTLCFLKDKFLKKKEAMRPEPKLYVLVLDGIPKGIEKIRKESIIKILNNIAPPHKMQFWNDIPVNDT